MLSLAGFQAQQKQGVKAKADLKNPARLVSKGVPQHRPSVQRSGELLGINLTEICKTCTLKTTKNYQGKLKKTKINVKTFCAYELEDFILLRWQYYPD